MAGTTTKGLRYPQAGDNPAVHTDIQNLATDVDTLLDSYLSGVITSVQFEGTTVDGYEITLTSDDPTADRTISLPDLSGTVMLRDATETISNKTLGSNLAAGGYKVTGLDAPTDDTDATTLASVQNIGRVTGFLLGGM